MNSLLDLPETVNDDCICPAEEIGWEDEYAAWAEAHDPAVTEAEIEAMERFHAAFNRLIEECE